jgi:Family of unknown function (DUF6526)
MTQHMPELEQSYAKHTKLVPLFHFFLFPLILLTLIGSLVNLYHSLGDHERIYNASLITAISVVLLLLSFFARIFALTVKQIVGLRFASDSEFVDLARKAAEGNLSPDTIKNSVKFWRPDHDRL